MASIRENKQELAQIYAKAANQLASELETGWTNFVIGYFVCENESDHFLVFVTNDEGKTWCDFMDVVFNSDEIKEGVFSCRESMQELHAVCAAKGDKWSCCTMIVNKYGEFSVEFDYKPMLEMNTVYRDIWKAKYAIV